MKRYDCKVALSMIDLLGDGIKCLLLVVCEFKKYLKV